MNSYCGHTTVAQSASLSHSSNFAQQSYLTSCEAMYHQRKRDTQKKINEFEGKKTKKNEEFKEVFKFPPSEFVEKM